MLLSNRIAVVTGAALGIGAGVAELFAQQGADVALVDIDGAHCRERAAAIARAGGKATAYTADVSNRSQLDAAFGTILERHGRIDVLVNNAGIYPRRDFVDMTEAEWDQMQDVNLKSLFYTCKLAVPVMMRHNYGKIVNISSVTFFKGLPRLSHYVASKGGMIGFSRSLARELGQYNIYINCVTPGAIRTEGEDVHADPAAIADIQNRQCLNRRLLPVDVARVCLFLATELSDGLTGQTINVDGGLVLY